MKKKPIHPLCEKLPRMTAAEYAGLVASIKENGQTDPVILLDGKVLDGRHRQDACADAGVACNYTDFKKAWGDPVQYVMARAIHRNLTDSQKAAAAAGFSDLLIEGGKERAKANLKNARRDTSGTSGELDPDWVKARAEGEAAVALGRSVERAAALFGVSKSYVQDARWVRAQQPKLFDQVFAGGVKLSVAKAEVRRHHKRQSLGKRISGPLPTAGRFYLHKADCIAGLDSLPRHAARLIFADPPYNQGVDYGKGSEADQLDAAEFIRWTEVWMEACMDALTPDGSMWVLISSEWADEFGCILKSIGLHRRSWIAWFESFGVNCSDNFNRCHRHLFYCVKDPARFVFDRAAFNRPSDRQAKYGDKRANPNGKIWDDVWGINPPIPRLVENATERLPDFPTQLPLDLVRPIVAGCTEPGDLVIDPFNGSGTTGVAAVTQGRDYIGFDISKKFLAAADARLRADGIGDSESIEEFFSLRKAHGAK